MTASELARILRARPVGRNKWLAKCPAHPDKHPSLSIAVGKSQPVVLYCQSNRCPTASILSALGLTLADLCTERRIDREAYRAIEMVRKRQRASEARQRASYARLCSQLRYWEGRAGELGKVLAENGNGKAAGLFHSALDRVRRIIGELESFAHPANPPVECIVWRPGVDGSG